MSDVCMYACMYQELLKATTNSSCVCAHFANKADSDSEDVQTWVTYTTLFLFLSLSINRSIIQINAIIHSNKCDLTALFHLCLV